MKAFEKAKKISTPTEAITRAADAAKILLPSSMPAASSSTLLASGRHLFFIQFHQI